jgi:hypothetical protein
MTTTKLTVEVEERRKVKERMKMKRVRKTGTKKMKTK